MDTTVVLDIPEALNRADGDQSLLLILADLFLQEGPEDVEAIHVALARQDPAGLAAAAHKLKGASLPIGAPRLFESAKRLEALGRQGELAEAALACAEVDVHLAEVLVALRKLIAG